MNISPFFLYDAAQSFATDPVQYIAIITSIGSVVAAVVAVIGAIAARRIRSPADENDAARVAREWYRGMLEDAKGEREELRKSIEELRTGGMEKSAAIIRLEKLIHTKDARIAELEERQRNNVEKLQGGQVLTLADILGLDVNSIPPLSVDMGSSQFPFSNSLVP